MRANRSGVSGLVLLSGLVALAIAPAQGQAAPDAPAARIELFANLAEARAHCPADAVIQVVLPDGFYLHGDRGMGGVSLDQVFVCKAEALRGIGAGGDGQSRCDVPSSRKARDIPASPACGKILEPAIDSKHARAAFGSAP